LDGKRRERRQPASKRRRHRAAKADAVETQASHGGCEHRRGAAIHRARASANLRAVHADDALLIATIVHPAISCGVRAAVIGRPAAAIPSRRGNGAGHARPGAV
jgi:hypothetical protein